MTRVVVRPDAARDLRLAARWYEKEEGGLGERFTDQVVATLERVAEFPEGFPEVAPRMRRALLHRFPYAVYFVTEPTRIVVIGVFHQRRAPSAWRERPR